jgi:hypothetical protein
MPVDTVHRFAMTGRKKEGRDRTLGARDLSVADSPVHALQPGPPRPNLGTAFQAFVIQESLLCSGERPSDFSSA